MRLIDADAFSAEMKRRQDACEKWMHDAERLNDEEMIDRANSAFSVFIETKLTLDKQPTIDAVEVVHGEWIEVHDWLHIPQEECGTYRCSACGQVMKYPWNYCPNCGVKMKGEEK